MADTATATALPQLTRLTNDDVWASLRAGWADFCRAPAFGLFFGAIFTVAGVIIYLQLLVWKSTYWVLPFAGGFPLIAPFLAVGLYAVSRRIARGTPLDWADVLRVPVRESKRQLPWLAFVVLFFYFVWVYMAHLIFALAFGMASFRANMTAAEILLSQEGLVMLAVGSAVGFVLAFLLFSVSVISFQMVLDRDIDFVTAMVLSVRCVLENKGPMLLWAIIVSVSSAVAMAPMFLGMVVVFPVLGHASWHLYTRAVAPR